MNQPDPTEAGAAILEAVENQLNANDPPKVKKTLRRLMSQGISEEESKKYIACALSVEIFGALKNLEEFKPQRYDQNLDNLPEMPWEDG
jgi:formate dehydrogenase maturation protein FdhE